MLEVQRLLMMSLDLVAVALALAQLKKAGASPRGASLAALLATFWLGLLHAALAGAWVPEQVPAWAFLAAVVLGVGAAGAVLAQRSVRAVIRALGDAQLLELQGVRVLFGATFFVQGLVGALPSPFGQIDGLTHFTAGALGLLAARALRSGRGPTLAWVANLFGLLDIVVVLSSLSLVLLPSSGARHPMLYAVFLPAPFWAWWHILSLARLLGLRSGPAVAAPSSLLGVALVVFLAGGSGCTPFILRTVMTSVDPYFHGPEIDRIELTQVSSHAYSFQWNWYRNLVIETSEGLVVIDPMGREAAAALKEALAKAFPGAPVRRVIYSHYHLDHVRGAELLAPAEVIAHANCAQYWAAIDHSGVLEPTRTIRGDVDLSLGGVRIEALDLGLSHTDTLYAFLLPEERVLFTADMALVKTVAPTGVPDRYAPGYLAALNRLAALDFDIFVPSHFGLGKKQDLLEWRDMLEYGRALARNAIAHSGTFGVQRDQLGSYFYDIYYPMRERYGDWHGFNEMIVLNIVRDIEGEGLGH